MITSKMLQKDHLCWKQMVGHEKRDAKNFSKQFTHLSPDVEELEKRLD